MTPNTNREEMNIVAHFRFGSPDSVDEDRIFVVDTLPSIEKCKRFCDGKEENRNLVVIEDGVVTSCYKGLPDETNNAIYHTHRHHNHGTTCPVTEPVHRIVPLKALRAIRLILSMLSRSKYRPIIKSALTSLNFARRKEVLAEIDFSSLVIPADAGKAVAFQLGQTISLIDGQELYTKRDIAAHCPDLEKPLYRERLDTEMLNHYRDRLLEQLYGVYVRQKGSLNLFCYENGPAIKEWNAFATQTRGMVLDAKSERCVYYPADKFFQVDEVPENRPERLPRYVDAEIVEKVDGSMISVFRHNGCIEYHCKGNFDVEQSHRAAQIAGKYDMDLLHFDRYWYVFEVLYPENRFPTGLCVTDYGDREDLVLTCMRDRRTNRMTTFADSIREARRVGFPHPAVFEGTIDQALGLTSRPQKSLDEEGYVARFANGKYLKIKYPAYLQVLKYANDLNANRFVKRYCAADKSERKAMLDILPPTFRAVADSQLQKYHDVVEELKSYFHSVVEKHEAKFPQYVLENVPADFQRGIFGVWRGRDMSISLEKLSLKIYYGKLELPVCEEGI